MAADGAGGAAEDADADAGGAARGRTRATGRDVRTRAEARGGTESKTRCQLAPPYQIGEERKRGASNSSLLGC